MMNLLKMMKLCIKNDEFCIKSDACFIKMLKVRAPRQSKT